MFVGSNPADCDRVSRRGCDCDFDESVAPYGGKDEQSVVQRNGREGLPFQVDHLRIVDALLH